MAPGSDAAAGSLIAEVTRLLGTQSGIATVLAAVWDRLPAALVGDRLSVDGSGVVQPVTVGNFPATQAVSGTVSLRAGAAQIGTIGNAFTLDATAQAGITSAAAIASATGTSADAATASGANTTVVGALRVIRNRPLATLTVSGTITANQGTADASAWKVDGSATTQPVSAAALSLPAGAAQDGADPAPPAVAKVGTDIRGWLATIAGLLKLGPATKAASASMTMATDLANIEPVGAAINGTAMPAGGVGLTGWLSALWSAITSANQRSAFLMEANGTAVGAGVTYTGAAGDAGGTPSVYACFSATVLSTQAGTLQIWANEQWAAWVLVGSVAVPAGVPTVLNSPVFGRYNHFRFVNGTTAGTVQAFTVLSTN